MASYKVTSTPAPFKSLVPKPVKLSEEALVKVDAREYGALPLQVQPNAEAVNLSAWIASNRAGVERRLLKHGGLLFRGFAVETIEAFRECVEALGAPLIEYGERSSPRSRMSHGVYTSTDHPADQHIVLHNEQSYTLNWPMKICFFCVTPPSGMGKTPLADSRLILNRITPETVRRFIEKQIMYVRNYGEGLGLSWQEAFQTNDRSMVESHCRNASMTVEWKDGGRLRTWQVRPAIRTHPKTGEPVWFNHALFFNLSSLDETVRRSMLAVVDENEVPYNTFYGDGSAIEPHVLDELRDAYNAETVSFPWRKGDLLILDNMLVSHGREPYVGARKIAVCMAEPVGEIVDSASHP